eukprot:COSAG02_NODE_15576_length_1159_cov_1.053774_3_plen_135_part_00
MQSPRGLRRNEIVKLVKRVEKRLLLLPPRFNIESDWELMLELSGVQTGLGSLDSAGLTRTLRETVVKTAVNANKAKSETPAAEIDADKYRAKPFSRNVLYLQGCAEHACVHCVLLQLLSTSFSSSAGGSIAWAC